MGLKTGRLEIKNEVGPSAPPMIPIALASFTSFNKNLPITSGAR